MRLFFVFLLFIQTTSVFAQNNDSSVIVKGHLRAILKKAQDEDKMILLFPTKKYVFTNESYLDSELIISDKNVKKGGVNFIIEPFKKVYDIDGWLSLFKNIYPKNYIIANLDFSYGEGLYFRNQLPISATNRLLNDAVIIMNKSGNIVRIISREDKEGLGLGYKNLSQLTSPTYILESLWKELPNYENLLKKRAELWNKYRIDKSDKEVIRKLYELNIYFDVLDCEVKDKYFEIRLKENESNFFEDEDELFLYACHGNSKIFNFFTTYTSRSYLSYFWLNNLYEKAVETKDDAVFKDYLTAYDILNCHCMCDEKNYEIARYYYEIGNFSNLKLYAEKQLNVAFFDLKSSCWKKTSKNVAKDKIATIVGRIVGFYAMAFSTHEELSTALYWAEKASELDETPLLLYSKAKVLYKLGKKQEALDIIKIGATKEAKNENNIIRFERHPKVNFTRALKEIEEGVF